MKLGWLGGLAAMAFPAAALPATAQAGHVHWGLSFGFGFSSGEHHHRYCAPAYVAPPPVTYYAPAQAYVEPAPVYAAPPAPYCPPPVVYSAPIVEPPVVYFGVGGLWHDHDRFYHREGRYFYHRR